MKWLLLWLVCNPAMECHHERIGRYMTEADCIAAAGSDPARPHPEWKCVHVGNR
jgi:hypothetical protein